ncbi:plasma membrane localization protein, partial [Podila epigama]
IIKSLLLASKAHLNIFSKNIVSILDSLLVDLSDLDIVRHCQNVFACFCSIHDGSTLSVDQEFRTIYDRVVSRFASIAVHKGDNANRYRMIGLRALEGVVASKALYACDHKAQLNLVLPSIIDTLIDAKDLLQTTVSTEPHSLLSVRRSVSIHVAVHPDNVVSDRDVTAEAIRCLHALFSSHNGANVTLVLGLTFTYMDEQKRWWPSALGVAIITAIVGAILPQYRYMVVNEIIGRMDGKDASSFTPSAVQKLQRKVTLVTALESVLVSSMSLIGMPVLEVLSSLLNILIQSLSQSTHMSNGGEASQLGALELGLQEGLTRSIGGLATHIYYTNQIPHIISHIVGKLSFEIAKEPQPDTMEGVPTPMFHKALLQCLVAVIKTSKDNRHHEANFHGTEVSADLLAPCLGLLLNAHVEVRTGFAQVLVEFLSTEDDEANDLSDDMPVVRARLPSVSGSDLYFRALSHEKLHAYARLPTATPADVNAFYNIFRALFSHFLDDEFIRVVPVLFSIQEWCLESEQEGHDEGADLVTRKRAVAAAIVQYLQHVVTFFEMTAPQEYLDNIKSSRENELQWVQWEDNGVVKAKWEAASEPTNPVLSHPLAREHFVTLLTTNSDRLRVGAERLGAVYNPESQAGLLTSQHGREYGSGVFLPGSPFDTVRGGHRSERSADSRIRVSRHLGDWALPKFIPSSSSGDLTFSSDESATSETANNDDANNALSPGAGAGAGAVGGIYGTKRIGVDTLKAALAAATAQAVAAAYGTDSTGSNTVSKGGDTLPISVQRHPSASVQAHTWRKHMTGSSVSTMASTLASSRPDLADILNTIQTNNATTTAPRMSMVVPPY